MIIRPLLIVLAITFSHIAVSTAFADTPKIAIAVPMSGDEAILGAKIIKSAETVLNGQAEIIIIDYPCDATVEDAARAFGNADYQAVMGVLCMTGFDAALDILGPKDIPLITQTLRADGPFLRAKNNNWPAFSLAPDQRAEANGIAAVLTKAWRSVPFAIIDDGTLYGRDLAETFRLEAETTGLQPVLVDTFRPQLENQNALVSRLVRAGATHVFVGSDRTEIATIARDTKARGDTLTIAGGEALNTADLNVPLIEGVLMVTPEEYVQPGNYENLSAASAQIALQLIADPQKRIFETDIGKVSFNAEGQRENIPYALWLYDGAEFQQILID